MSTYTPPRRPSQKETHLPTLFVSGALSVSGTKGIILQGTNIAHLWKKMHLQNAFEKGPWLYSSPEGTHIPIHIPTKQNNISIHHSEIA